MSVELLERPETESCEIAKLYCDGINDDLPGFVAVVEGAKVEYDGKIYGGKEPLTVENTDIWLSCNSIVIDGVDICLSVRKTGFYESFGLSVYAKEPIARLSSKRDCVIRNVTFHMNMRA